MLVSPGYITFLYKTLGFFSYQIKNPFSYSKNCGISGDRFRRILDVPNLPPLSFLPQVRVRSRPVFSDGKLRISREFVPLFGEFVILEQKKPVIGARYGPGLEHVIEGVLLRRRDRGSGPVRGIRWNPELL